MLFGKKSKGFHGSSGFEYSKSRKNQSKHKKPLAEVLYHLFDKA